ncbi:MAG: ribosome silencing factor [Verrucomicrobia bacterium]|nr:MAG: ribosome silencing factor [Verrucomicrobiota bacterium]
MNKIESLALAQLARKALLDKKGVNPILLDVRELSSVTDYYLIATGNSAPHLKALGEEMNHVLGPLVGERKRRAGNPDSGWLVVDYLSVVVHLFLPHTREYYALEELWSDAPRIN